MEWGIDSAYKIATMAGALVSAVSLIYIAKQAKAIRSQTASQKEQEGVTRADHYVREYRDIRVGTERIRQTAKNKSIEAICNEIDNDEETRSHWYEFLEYFERLGTLFHLGTIDNRYVLRTLDAIIVDAWELTEPVIKAFRKRDNDPLIFEHFEQLYGAAKKSVTRES